MNFSRIKTFFLVFSKRNHELRINVVTIPEIGCCGKSVCQLFDWLFCNNLFKLFF
jgi:hypothetical protein